MIFSPNARWVWCKEEPAPRNLWLRFRRRFVCPGDVKKATLSITADNRYELFVNAQEIGNGPVRSFPWAYSYDEYDVTSWLLTGEANVLAARVVYWGDHTFQSIRARGGFLCELLLERHNGSIERVVSDKTWQVAPDAAFAWNTPRISIQQAFEEHYDARCEEPWLEASYSSNDWESATIIGAPGCEPWTTLIPRAIPFLTREMVSPAKVLAVELAQPLPGYSWCFDLRHRVADLTIGLRAEASGTRGSAFATEIIAPYDCNVRLHFAQGCDYLPGWQAACNGQVLYDTSRLELRKGRNLFIVTGSWWPSIHFQTTETLAFDASRLVPDEQTTETGTWAYLGPFDERDDTTSSIQAAIRPSDISESVPRHLIRSYENQKDIFLLTKAQQYLLPPSGFCDAAIRKAQPRKILDAPITPLVENSAQLLHPHAGYALLHPQEAGDIHLIIDFGREVCGFPILELAAPAGTIVDANFFEGIDESGVFWTEGLRNSFRYTCRAGYQMFRSHQRRGFRYASLTFRIPSGEPVKLYQVSCLQNLYPVERRGSFTSSDTLLNTIWEVACRTVQLCMEDTYVDCPAYEQVFWVGDARNSALVNALAFGAYDLTARCLDLVSQSLSRQLDVVKPPGKQQRDHLTTDHTVSGWFSEIPMWTFLWIWSVEEHYQFTGNLAALSRFYPAVRECLEHCLHFLSPRGLLNLPDVCNLVDWAAMDMTGDGEVTSSNALLVESLRKAANMAETLAMQAPGQEEPFHQDAARYLQAASHITEAINRYCWSEARGAYVDTVRDEQAYDYHTTLASTYHYPVEPREQFLARTRISEQTNTLVLLCNCATADRAERIFPLVEAARSGKFVGSAPEAAPSRPAEEVVPIGSPWFLFFTLETLIVHHQMDTALSIIREQWGRMLEKGATTFWETFPSTEGPHWSRSLCHGWSAAPAYVLSRYVLGIQPAAPGYAHVEIRPHACDLRWARGTVPTPHGDVSVQWTRDSHHWEITIGLPPTLTGEVVLEKGDGLPQQISGEEGTIIDEQQQWRIVLPQGSSSCYHFLLTGVH